MIAGASTHAHSLLFGIRRSIRYHDRRQGWFELLHTVAASLSALLAGTVLLDLVGSLDMPLYVKLLGFFSALFSVLDLVVGFAKRASLHKELKQRFCDLEVTCLSKPEDWESHQMKRLRIEQDEPPVYRVLDVLCHNELLTADGYPPQERKAHAGEVSSFQRLTRHLLRWENYASDYATSQQEQSP